jgi:paraquat-inducible protein B
MSGSHNSAAPPASPDDPRMAGAVVRRRRRFSLIWLIPIVCLSVAVYLVFETLLNRGPLITITFKTGNGVVPQQTQVTHKAVPLGMVEDMRLSDDLQRVLIHVRMNRQGEKILTNHARFWVVRPRLSTGNISGLETLVSGAYIEVDPGAPGGEEELNFTGLEEPPGVRSDEPGRTYVLHAGRLGSLGPGAPVFYRDVSVGEVLGYDLGNGLDPVTINIFVRDPYDKFVHEDTHFWNASGISASLGPQGVHLELESLQAILSGGIAFETPHTHTSAPISPADRLFTLYKDKGEADDAGYTQLVPFVSYFTSSVSGLGRGSAVNVFGIQVGAVTDVKLLLDSKTNSMVARVSYDLQPQRVFSSGTINSLSNPQAVTQSLVRQGMRAVLESSNFITGQKDVSLQYVPNAPEASVTQEGDTLVMPSQGGGLDNITTSLSDIATKLDRIPFDEIGKNLNLTLRSISQTVSGPDVKNALQKLSETLTDIQHLVRNADHGLTPVLQRLPKMSQDLQQTLAHANAALGEGGYGSNSDFARGIARVLDQVNDAARSIRMLADFLDRHPEALVRGRTGGSEK